MSYEVSILSPSGMVLFNSGNKYEWLMVHNYGMRKIFYPILNFEVTISIATL